TTVLNNGHPITRGCHGYVAEDEWYFDIRFRPNDANVVPIMTGKLPPRDPQDKVLAWACTRPDGGRGFGFAGGHFSSNWHMEPFRKLVLNAILWVAKAEVPQDGVSGVETWRFVSIPNFVGADLAYPQPGWEDTLDYILKAVKAENPQFVLIPGDLVSGRWSDKAAIDKLAPVQYAAWIKRMEAHGLRFYAAVGDSEVGGSPWPVDKAALVPVFKRQFQRFMNMPRNGPLRMKGTAFSALHENTLFVALDVFERDSGSPGGIVPQVTGEQLQWLEQTLADNCGVAHIVALGHAPVLTPAGTDDSGSLMLAGGRQSPLWQALRKHGVDLYLCGDARAVACAPADDILQIASGQGIGREPKVNYLVATVYPDRIDLELKEIPVIHEGGRLPQTGEGGPSERVRIADEMKQKGFTTIGTASLHAGPGGALLTNTSGLFAEKPLP
ncbi:MAG: ThuA domain-containing protein, partial [Planctomycetes bacterium]|nr:ThuA domain-containing protein [Planctomycetota bacterium]